MTLVIGIALETSHARAIGISHGKLRWTLDAEVGPDGTARALLEELLSRCPMPRWPPPHIYVAVGPARAQLKRVSGLPPIQRGEVLDQLVRGSASRFFVGNPEELSITGAQVTEPGTAWVAAVDRTLVSDLVAACASRHVRLEAVLPAALAVTRGASDGAIILRDGDVAAAVSAKGAFPVAIRRVVPPSDEPRAVASDRLSPLGERAITYAAAYGATRTAAADRLVLRGASLCRPASRSHRRLTIGVVALLLATGWALGARAVSAMLAARRAEQVLARMRRSVGAALDAERELAATTAVLDRMGRFEQRRRLTTVLLANLTRVLPAGSAMLTLQADSAGGSMVVVSSHAADVVTSVDAVTGLAGVEVIGPVTHENMAGRDVERVAIRFRYAADDSVSTASRGNP